MSTKWIDTSTYNGIVDFKSAKEQGVDGAVLKIISKSLDLDKQFKNSYLSCEKVGLEWSCYNYTYATTAAKAKSDMTLICDILDKITSKKYFNGIVWFDLEDKIQEKLNKSTIKNILSTAQSTVESRGYKFGVYTGLSYYNSVIKGSGYNTCKRWWIARYYNGYTKMNFSAEPNSAYKPTCCDIYAWQYTSVGRFSPTISHGNNYNLDVSIVYKTESNSTTTTMNNSNVDIVFPSKGYYSLGDGYKANTSATYKKYITMIQKKVGLTGVQLDGKYGANTKKYVEIWQEKNGLTKDGQFGKLSAKKAGWSY